MTHAGLFVYLEKSQSMRLSLLIFFVCLSFALQAQYTPALQKQVKSCKGAIFPKAIIRKLAIGFSGADQKDTLLMIVPAGKISDTYVSFKVKTAKQKVLFSSDVPTKFFAYGVYALGHIAKNTEELSGEVYNEKTINAQSAKSIEQYTRNQLDSFFNKIIASNFELESHLLLKSYSIEAEQLFMRSLNDPLLYPVFIFPEVEWDEGFIDYVGFAFDPNKKQFVRVFMR